MMVKCSGRYSDAAMMRSERRRKRTESAFLLAVFHSNSAAVVRGHAG